MPREWIDHIVERPRTFTMQQNPDGTVTLIPAPGQIIQQGTPVNAANLNGIEQDLESHMAETMPHMYVDDGKTYRWGFRTVNGKGQFIYEEVVE